MLLGHWQEMRALGQAQGRSTPSPSCSPTTPSASPTTGVETVTARTSCASVTWSSSAPAGGSPPTARRRRRSRARRGHGHRRVPPRRPRGLGDRVVAGTVSTDSTLRVRVEAVGEDTALGGIQRLVAEAQASAPGPRPSPTGPPPCSSTSPSSPGSSPSPPGLRSATATTPWCAPSACSSSPAPTPSGLAIPLTISLSTAVAAKAGILVKDRLALERMRTVDTVLFDKTGTLTKGEHVVSDVAVAGDPRCPTRPRLLRLAAAVEADSEHPLARAIVTAARQHGAVPTATRVPGPHRAGRASRRRRRAPSPSVGRRCSASSASNRPPSWPRRPTRGPAQGAAVLHVIRDGRHRRGARPRRRDPPRVRPSRRRAAPPRRAGRDDHRRRPPVADAVAARLGVDEVFAEVLPEDKDSAVTQLQAPGPAGRHGR